MKAAVFLLDRARIWLYLCFQGDYFIKMLHALQHFKAKRGYPFFFSPLVFELPCEAKEHVTDRMFVSADSEYVGELSQGTIPLYA